MLQIPKELLMDALMNENTKALILEYAQRDHIMLCAIIGCIFEKNPSPTDREIKDGTVLAEAYAYDPLGRRASTTAGGVTVRHVYDGAHCAADTDSSGTLLRSYSWATGLYNFRLRWYDPATGRWLSKDPIGISGGLNLYAFCGNDPVNSVDPWGLREEGEQALSWAKSEVGNESYSGTGNLPGPFGPGDPKCNIFVAHAYNKGNGKTIIPTGFWGSRPPKARDWFTNNVPPGFTLTTTPRPGDVISDGHHMGLVSEHGKSTVSAATALGVVENSWGYRTNSRPNVYYHYDGGR